MSSFNLLHSRWGIDLSQSFHLHKSTKKKYISRNSDEIGTTRIIFGRHDLPDVYPTNSFLTEPQHVIRKQVKLYSKLQPPATQDIDYMPNSTAEDVAAQTRRTPRDRIEQAVGLNQWVETKTFTNSIIILLYRVVF